MLLGIDLDQILSAFTCHKLLHDEGLLVLQDPSNWERYERM